MAASTRKKKSTKKKKASTPAASLPPIPLAEIFAVLCGTGGVILGLALVSYHPGDPSWNNGGSSSHAQNWIGNVGANLAESLVQLLGVPALMVPIALILLALSLFQHKSLYLRWTRWMAAGTLTFFSCVMLSLYPTTLSRDDVMFRAGGVLGDGVSAFMISYLSTVGTWVVVIASLIIALQVTLALEIGPAVLRAVGLVSGAAKVTGGAVALGAGAVGGAAASGASSVGQRFRDAWIAWQEEREQRRLDEEAEEDEEDEEEAPPPEPEEKPKGRRGKKGLELPVAGDVEPLPLNGSNARNGDGRGEEALAPVVSRQSRPQALEEDEDSQQLDLLNLPPNGAAGPMDEEDEDFGADEDAMPMAGAPRARRGKPEPAGPKIVKSRYMEEPGQFSGENVYEDGKTPGDYVLPPMSFLKLPPGIPDGVMSEEELLSSARLLEEKLRDYGVEGRVVEIHPGPVITMYEYAPAPGVKVSKITNLSNDLALALRAAAVRIVAPLPGKAAVGIEVPNKVRQTVYLREILDHDEFRREQLKLPIAIGKDIAGKPYAGDLAKMPHLLVAGSTGAGKSVAVNAMLLSLFYARKPDEVRLIMVDPKMIEFSVYNDIPHLLMPVVTDPHKAASALNWGVEEMERRYRLLTIEGARNIANYNAIMEERAKTWTPETAPEGQIIPRKLPYIVIVIDELADLMMVAGKEVQDSIVRLAQKARAAGIHLVLATQRPSVDVITGLIKANFPARIAFKVASKTDSRTILDANGAEYLLGNGDMLHLPPGTAGVVRLHGAFTSDEEAKLVADHLRAQGQPRYEESLLASTAGEKSDEDEEEEEEYDEFYEEAKLIVLESGQASISTIQRRLKIGYNRSARMVERMAKEGLVGPPTQAGKPREIYMARLQASLKGR